MKKLLIGIFIFFGVINNSYTFDLNNVTYNSNISSIGDRNSGIKFSNDGFKLYTSNDYVGGIREHNLSIAYDPSTIIYSKNYSFGSLRLISFDISNDGTELLIKRTLSAYTVYHYTLTTPYDIDTKVLQSSFNGTSTYQTISYIDDGNKLILTGSDFIVYDLTTPYDISTKILNYTTTDDYSHPVFNSDGLKFFALDSYASGNLRYYDLNTPYDITTRVLNSSTSLPLVVPYQGFGFNNDFSKILYATRNDTSLRIYDVNDSLPVGPPILNNANISNVDSLENGVNVSFICEQDCEVNIGVYSNDDLIFYNNNTGVFSGSLIPQNITIPVTLQYQGQYKIIGAFYDINDPLIEILDERVFTYWFNPDPNSYVVGDFTFNAFDFERLSNGFEIRNLNVEPEGGVFFLTITAPNGYDTGLYTDHIIRVWNDSVEQGVYGTGYGSGSVVQVNYPYHKWAGDYELLITYEYPNLGQSIYPFGTGSINYSIINPEWSEEEAQVYLCDTNDDGYISDVEIEGCTDALNGNFIENTWEFFRGIKLFFSELMKLGQVEPKEWGFLFIPQANAESVIDRIPLEPNYDDNNILTDFYGFLKGFILFAFLILAVIILIVTLKKE